MKTSIPLFAFFANLILGGMAIVAASPAEKEKPLELKEAVAIMEKSKDQDQLLKAALALAQSKDPKALDSLVEFLKQPAFLLRLDSKDDYDFRYSKLRIEKVLAAIAKIGTQKAEEALIVLGKDQGFFKGPGWDKRMRLLVNSTSEIRNPSEKLLDFLDSLDKFDDSLWNSIVKALARMRSSEASKRVVKRFSSREFDVGDKLGFCLVMLTLRDDPTILPVFRKLLSSEIKEEELRERIVLTLFDYRPRDWFSPSSVNPPKPPPREQASAEVLKELLELAELALKFGVSDDAKQSVQKAQKEIKEILDKRKEKK